MKPNPWLAIPWQDYEGHMISPEVGQLQLLSRRFGEALRRYRPASAAILGCATGNGLEHVDPAVTRTVVGLDVNPAHLAVARRRFADAIEGDYQGEHVKAQNAHVYIAHDGPCVDVHVSRFPFAEGAQAQLSAIVASVAVEALD